MPHTNKYVPKQIVINIHNFAFWIIFIFNIQRTNLNETRTGKKPTQIRWNCIIITVFLSRPLDALDSSYYSFTLCLISYLLRVTCVVLCLFISRAMSSIILLGIRSAVVRLGTKCSMPVVFGNTSKVSRFGTVIGVFFSFIRDRMIRKWQTRHTHLNNLPHKRDTSSAM